MTDDDIPGEPTCPTCGTVLHAVRGGYECRWCEVVHLPVSLVVG